MLKVHIIDEEYTTFIHTYGIKFNLSDGTVAYRRSEYEF